MDTHDLQILQLIQSDNRRSAAEIGQEIGLSVSAVSDRLRRLNASGVIKANHAVIDPARVGVTVCAFIFVDLEPRADETAFAAALRAFPEVQEGHHITGKHSWLLKVRVRDTAALQRFLAARLKATPGVLRTETIIALDTAKETSELALPDAAGLEGAP
ncbi:Lrp/AsnC family transcriptional regulator [Pseudoduganella namucuonensis]|uniref:Lrp/AsnC family transcriptional regulator, leucine-responsive regulatory protein n=1 Tax=Pseudoduganella namucuonensis TaxID=1035707 RepID=A0A1I7M5S6_9BURK|nr:Lrp/AsnC family transcriptional regulator [Pseudoduganella namucuonensis]SFV17246.1 Lrp/AsnC family transcriptional regulator, leucine-responsive regulatory protein [Pseudoduganella namucuonensis]